MWKRVPRVTAMSWPCRFGCAKIFSEMTMRYGILGKVRVLQTQTDTITGNHLLWVIDGNSVEMLWRV